MCGTAWTAVRWILGGAALVALALSAAGQQPGEAISRDELALVKAAEGQRIAAIAAATPSVVSIYGSDRAGGGGSGVLVDPAGFALTNHHVVMAAGLAGWAGLSDGQLYRWRLIGTDPGGDLALVQLAGRDRFPAARLGDSNRVQVGDWAVAAGNPFALAEDQQPTVTLGIVSGVHRYQSGSGLNQLIYGDCLQVDSSINPGNSGGPLFNLRGEVIGINGRASFEERGRVNVGLGYAISVNQARRFLPELLASKIAQHGTLDAVFANRPEGVLCQTINLESPAARAGLALGDRLVALEDVPITDANQLAGLITTFPAGWPVKVEFQHGGRVRTIHVRLLPLPYERFQPAEPGSEPGAAPPEGGPPDGGSQRVPKAVPRPVRKPPLPLAEAGKIRDATHNAAVAKRLLEEWRRGVLGDRPADAALRVTSELRRAGRVVGQQTLIAAPGGRAGTEYDLDGKRSVIVCDGRGCQAAFPGRSSESIPRGRALLDPHFAQAVVLAALLDGEAIATWGMLALDGADKAGGRLCYRLSITEPATSEQLFVWLTDVRRQDVPVVSAGQGATRMLEKTNVANASRAARSLVKTGVGLRDDEPVASTCYEEFTTMGGTLAPGRRWLVRGLAEEAELEIQTLAVQAITAESSLFTLGPR